MEHRPTASRDTVALVLCGGEGSRIRPLSFLIRKEMLPIGRNRKPILEFIVNHLRSHGIRDIVLLGSTPDGGDVANYFGDGRGFGVRMRHLPDPEGCHGTGRALLWAVRHLGLMDKLLLVYYGDILTRIDLGALIASHSQRDESATLVLSNRYVIPKGVAILEDQQRVTSFIEKPEWRGKGHITMGILIINPQRLASACGPLPTNAAELGRSRFADLMGNIVPHLIEHDDVGGFLTSDPWIDIGSFEDYSRVSATVDWIGKGIDDMPATERGLTVFLSYHLCEENERLVEDRLRRSLECTGTRVILGGQLYTSHRTTKAVRRNATDAIDAADGMLVVATPDREDGSPSDFVQFETAYAHGQNKLFGLFIEKGTRIPEPWRGYTWKYYDRADGAAFVRDVLETALGRVTEHNGRGNGE